MIRPARTVLVLLAAGLSRRFADAGSKLDADLDGRPVGRHAAEALAGMGFLDRVAVTGRARLDYSALGFRVVPNPAPERGMSGSVRLGVAAARDLGADAVLVALADMPRITTAHVARLFDAARGADAVVASVGDGRACPPALFGRDRFDALEALAGDAGARDLIAAGVHVAAPPGELADVDTADDLTRAGARQSG